VCFSTQDEFTPVLPTLSDFRVNPPDTNAELAYPPIDARSDNKQSEAQGDGNHIGIDWGLAIEDVDASATVDWGVATEDVDASAPIDIDWNIGAIEETDLQDSSILENGLQNSAEEVSSERNDAAAVQEGGEAQDVQLDGISWDVDVPAEINWDIDIEEDGIVSTPETSQVEHQQTSNEDGHALKSADRQDASTSWFAKTENRTRLLDDLFEVYLSNWLPFTAG
jgi:hypothetical protein